MADLRRLRCRWSPGMRHNHEHTCLTVCDAANYKDIEIMITSKSLVSKLPKDSSKNRKIKIICAEDMTLPYLKHLMNCQNIVNSDIQSYWNICDSLHETQDQVFYSSKLVISQKINDECYLCSLKVKWYSVRKALIQHIFLTRRVIRHWMEDKRMSSITNIQTKLIREAYDMPHCLWQKVAAYIMPLFQISRNIMFKDESFQDLSGNQDLLISLG